MLSLQLQKKRKKKEKNKLSSVTITQCFTILTIYRSQTSEQQNREKKISISSRKIKINKSSQPSMLNSTAHQRLREESPKEEFEPKTVFFCSEGEDKEAINNWLDSFWVKAAVVYHAIMGIHVNPRATQKASRLLIEIAHFCRDPTAAAPATEAPEADPKNEEFIKKLTAEQKEFIDGVYLVVGFLPTLKPTTNGVKWDREEISNNYLSTRSHEIVTDVIKIGNQIPLACIVSVVENVEGAVKKAKVVIEKPKDTILPSDAGKQKPPSDADKQKPSSDADKQKPPSDADKQKPSDDADKQKLHNTIDKYSLSFYKDNFNEVFYLFCCYYSPFYYKAAPNAAANKKLLKEAVAAKKSNLLECVYGYVTHAWDKQSGTASGDAEESGWFVYSTPTARGLRRAGVGFAAADLDCLAKFQFTEPVLNLPRLMFDFKAETVARNLMALELSRGHHQRPLTRYFQFMNELVVDIGDVKVLRRAGVIRGGSKAGVEVLEMVQKIDGFATYPSSFPAIDKEIEKAHKYYERRMKSFLVRHRPAVVWVSSVAAVSVIGTAVYASRRRARG